MSWRILYIDESESVSCYLDNIKIDYKDKDSITVPLKDIHSIIIDNPKLILTTQLINRCATNNINLVICGVDHLPNALLHAYQPHFNSALVLRKQLEWGDSQKEYLHQQIVKHKIINQISACEICRINPYQINFGKLNLYVDEVELSDTTNREGLAAKVYFSLMYGNSFRRFDDDVINGGLNYGYAVLRSQISKTLIAKGLNTSLGIFHKGPGNIFNLSDDIIEVFRPIVDIWVFNNLSIDDEELTRENRVGLIKATTSKVIIDGKKQTIFNAISIMIDSILNFFETGDMELLFPKIVDDL